MLSLSLLRQQDDTTTRAVISSIGDHQAFVSMSKELSESISTRDAEDGNKLAAGISRAIECGVLDSLDRPVYKPIDTLGKTADEVADSILRLVGDNVNMGCVVVVCGRSGVGKGTAMNKLSAKLPKCVTWSNGNAFRALTLLVLKDNEEDLSPNALSSHMRNIKFGEFNGKFDVLIHGVGLVSDIENTLLKSKAISKAIPRVAEASQGEVVKFACDAIRLMSDSGITVLVEGRAETLDYITSPYRFELIMSDTSVIGKRRAAQILVAKFLSLGVDVVDSHADIQDALVALI